MKANRGGWKTCSRGHKYRGSEPCPICWPGRIMRAPMALKPSRHRTSAGAREPKRAKLTRPRYTMTPTIRNALTKTGLMSDYHLRPAYQQNDYIGWITRAKRPETMEKRLRQMLHELRVGGLYMKMKHAPSKKD